MSARAIWTVQARLIKRKFGYETAVYPPEPAPAGWTGALVWGRLVEAAAVLHQQPDRERGWLKDNGYWPYVPVERKDWWAKQVENAAAIPDVVKAGLGVPSAQAIRRMEEAFGWLAWVPIPHRRILWALAEGLSPGRVRTKFGCHRNTILNRKKQGLREIARRLDLAGVAVEAADD